MDTERRRKRRESESKKEKNETHEMKQKKSKKGKKLVATEVMALMKGLRQHFRPQQTRKKKKTSATEGKKKIMITPSLSEYIT